MFHSICMIFELLYLKKIITEDSTVSLSVLEEAFYNLQDILNAKTDAQECLVFDEAIDDLLENYGYLFNLDDDEISFNEEFDPDNIYDEICEILGDEKTYIDEEYIQNIIIYHTLKLPIPLEETQPYFSLNQNLVHLFYLLSYQEANNENTSIILKTIIHIENKLKEKIKNADDETLIKLKMCFAHYNNIYLSDAETPNINTPWHMLLLDKEDTYNKSLLYEKLEALCAENDEMFSLDSIEDSMELEDIPEESCYIADEIVLFFNYYIIYLNNYLKECSRKIKKELIEKKYLLLSIGYLQDTEEYFLEHGTIDTLPLPPIKKEWLTTEHFNFLVSNFEEILENIRQKDKNIVSTSFIITNVLLLKCYLDLSVNETIKKELIAELTNDDYYKKEDYQIYTYYIDDIVFNQKFLSRLRKKNE